MSSEVILAKAILIKAIARGKRATDEIKQVINKEIK